MEGVESSLPRLRRLNDFNNNVESILIDRESCERLNEAVKEMSVLYVNEVKFIMEQIGRFSGNNEKFKREQGEVEK